MNMKKSIAATLVTGLFLSAPAAVRQLDKLTLTEGSSAAVKAFNASDVKAVTPSVASAVLRDADINVSGLAIGTSEIQLLDARGVFASFQVRVVPTYWDVLTKIFEDDPEVVREIIGGKVVLSGTTASSVTLEHVKKAQEIDPLRIVSQVTCSPEAVQLAVQDFLTRSHVTNVTATVTGHEVCLNGRVYDTNSAESIGKRVQKFLTEFKDFSVNWEGLKVFKQKILINIEFVEWNDTRARNLGIKLGDSVTVSGTASYDYGWTKGSGETQSSKAGAVMGPNSSSGTSGSTAEGKLQATLNLAKHNGVAKKTYGTQLSTQSGEEVKFQNGGTTYIRTAGGVGTAGELRQFDYGYQITAKPVIVDRETLNLDFNLDYSKLSDRTAAQAASGDYAINRYQTKSKYVMRPGESIMISGFDSTVEEESKNGWPFLSHIWGMQWLFGNTSRAHEQKEMVLVVTVDWAVEDSQAAQGRLDTIKAHEVSVEMP